MSYQKKSSYNLENRVDNNNYKSNGERRIAQFLNYYDIKFTYEKPTLIQDHDSKSRIWYPDFHLPEFDIILEYYGMAGDNGDYDKGVKRKQEAYTNGNNKVIALYPEALKGNWQQYILNSIQHILQKRKGCLETKLNKNKKQ